MITALRATSRTLADYLKAQFAGDPVLQAFFGSGGSMDVYLDTPAQMATRSGLSVWLYRVVRDDITLNRRPERIDAYTQRRLPLPARLHYLLTPVTHNDEQIDAPETELTILGKVLQCFNDQPQLTGTNLSDDFAGTTAVVTVRLETLTLDEMTRIWDALEAPYRTSVSYEVTVVDIEAALSPEVGPPVRRARSDVGVITGIPVA